MVRNEDLRGLLSAKELVCFIILIFSRYFVMKEQKLLSCLGIGKKGHQMHLHNSNSFKQLFNSTLFLPSCVSRVASKLQ